MTMVPPLMSVHRAPEIFIGTVKTVDGWVGQIFFGECLLWQSKPTVAMTGGPRPRSRKEALGIAKRRVEHRLADLFADADPA